jgi:regulator of protease activity HflC (stomatin/prohibitin superfamily)
MGWFITGIVVLILAILVGIGSIAMRKPEEPAEGSSRRAYEKYDEARTTKKFGYGLAGALTVIGLILWGAGSLYTQDPGEGVVLRSISGEVVGETSEPGFHTKAPWVSASKWDIRDNTMQYLADGKVDYSGGSAVGPRITVQDKDGVDADIDLTLRYSIEGDKVDDLYSRFGSQENLLTKVVEPGIRSATREIPVAYSTLDILNKRAEIQAEVKERLTNEWADLGIVVEDVDVQEIVQPQEIKDSNAAQAAAQALVETEKARLEQAKIEAQKNEVKTEALTPEILTQQYIEALKGGTVFVVPEGSTPMIQVPQK